MSHLPKSAVLYNVVQVLKDSGVEVYQTYITEEQYGKPAIHIEPASIKTEALVKLVNCMGAYNFASPEAQLVLLPYNYGEAESYLSLEPATACGDKDLRAFLELLHVYMK